MKYTEDHLGLGFEYTVIEQPDDYEGKVITTLIRKKGNASTTKAVLYVHGFNDYFFQSEMAEQFNANEFNFYALDLRKYGRSLLPHQKMNTMRSLTEYYEDLDAALTIIRQEGNKQVLLSGHSTGGLLVTLYASERVDNQKFESVFCNSPFYDFNMPNYQKRFLIPWVCQLGKYFPQLSIPGGLSHWYGYSLHKAQKGEWEYNLTWKPHVVPNVNAGWINAIHKGHLKIKKGIHLTCPIIVMHSDKSSMDQKWNDHFFEADAVLDVKDIKKEAEKIVAPKRTIIEIKNGMHDLILSSFEVRKKVYTKLFDWLAVHLK